MEPLFVKGTYVYVGNNAPQHKGVSLYQGTNYEVMPIELDGEWFGFLYAPDGCVTRVPMCQFKTVGAVRIEIINEILSNL